ncbi:YraN family protein [Brevibacillus daliensis]|uniref:YraN family protein n=1 Tax=Brevibacillus daliensis TaxID=2892995 RepID=UPI001E483A10|nr:YraN family protein [Brevibacillus daliensis]
MSDSRKHLGKIGEEYASSFLRNLGYEIVDRNVRLPGGELDIVARDGGELVIIEVRSRKGKQKDISYGSPLESITWRKQAKLRQLLIHYLQQNQHVYNSFRIDVIGILFSPDLDAPPLFIEHVKHV